MSLNTLLILLTAVVSFLSFNNHDLFAKMEFNAYLTYHRKQWHRLFSHALIHADFMHLLVNMIVLWSFGRIVEAYFTGMFGMQGNYYFLMLYAGGVVVASLPSLFRHKDNPAYNAVGASGAVSAVLFSAILFEPMSKIYLFFIPIGIPAFIFGPLYLAYEIYMDKKSQDRVAHDAHYWGAIFGLLFTILVQPKIVVYFFEQILGF
ncbi:MAG TPA: rhomboid family intramembrane serine protease [Flavobacteriales bacterium]|nr:rhomboid family intramembrane serine protease [Flavobacteriales bacterium]